MCSGLVSWLDIRGPAAGPVRVPSVAVMYRHPVSAARAQEFGCCAHIAERRGQPDPRDAAPDGELDAVQQRLQLRPAFGAKERVQLVDDDVAKSAEQ